MLLDSCEQRMNPLRVELSPLEERVSRRLRERALPIVDKWIDFLLERVGTRTVRGLPRDAIRNHIPPVLESIAEYVRTPIEIARQGLLGHLQLHGRLRREQGYDLSELLTEFDALCHIVVDDLGPVFDEDPNVSAAELVTVLGRLHQGLRAISFMTVNLYRDSEQDRQRQLATKLEDLARTIAHEVRTPLQTINLGVSMLAKNEVVADEARRERFLSAMSAATSRTSDLLDNVRQLAIAESGRQRKFVQGRLRPILEEVLEELSNMATARKVDVVVDSSVPDVAVDRLAFQLALMNIVSNAIKYSDPEKPERRVEVSFRVERYRDGRDLLVVNIDDNGVGIPAEHRERIFHRHVRIHPDVADGTGLGLAIVRQQLGEVGGKVEVSEVASGQTRFAFQLPALPGEISEGGDHHEPLANIIDNAVHLEQQKDTRETASPAGDLEEL